MRTMLLTLVLLSYSVTAQADELSDLRSELKQVQAELAQAKRDREVMLERVISIADVVNELQTKHTKLEELVQQLKAQVTYGRVRISEHSQDLGLWLITPLDGVVIATKDKLMELSVGRDDGVCVGMEVEILREKKVLGTAVIRKVGVTRSVAEPKGEFKEMARKGDTAAWPKNIPTDKDSNSLRQKELEERKLLIE